MKIIALILSLVCGAMALHPNGVTHYLTKTVNAAQVTETSTDFVHQWKIPRPAIACTSAVNVVVYNQADSARYPRWVVYTVDTVYVYANSPKSTSTNTVVTVGFGLGLAEVNAAATFTNSGITNFWGMNEVSGTVLNSYVGGISGELISPSAIQVGGLFNNYTKCNTSGDITYGKPAVLSGAQHFTISMLVNFSVIGGGTERSLFYQGSSASSRVVINCASTGNLVYDVSNGSSSYCYVSVAGLSTNSWHHCVFTFDGTQPTNATKTKMYIDGVAQTLNFYGIMPNTTANISGNTAETGVITSGSPEGVDELGLYSTTMTENDVIDRYNMFFSPSTYYSTSRVFTIPIVAATGTSRWSAYKSAYKPAFKSAFR